MNIFPVDFENIKDLYVSDEWPFFRRRVPITKTRLFKYIEKFTSKNWKFSDIKTLIFFLFLLKT